MPCYSRVTRHLTKESKVLIKHNLEKKRFKKEAAKTEKFEKFAENPVRRPVSERPSVEERKKKCDGKRLNFLLTKT